MLNAQYYLMSYLSIYLNIRYSTDPDPPYSHFRYTTYTTGPNSITINFLFQIRMAMLTLNHIVIKALDIQRNNDDFKIVEQGKIHFIVQLMDDFHFIFSC